MDHISSEGVETWISEDIPTADKLTDAEKKKIKNANKAKANPKLAAEKAVKNDARMEKRGMTRKD